MIGVVTPEHLRRTRAFAKRCHLLLRDRHLVPNLYGTIGEAVLTGLRLVLGALVIVEFLFVWPGLGVLALRALNVQDLSVLLACVAVFGLLFVAIGPYSARPPITAKASTPTRSGTSMVLCRLGWRGAPMAATRLVVALPPISLSPLRCGP